MKTSHSKKQSGFTLIELLVVLAIIGILTSVGIPSYNKFVEHGRFAQAYNNLYNAYRFARAEAIKTSSPMVLTANGGDWDTGWYVHPQASSTVRLLDAPAVKTGVEVTVPMTSLTIEGRGSIDALTIVTLIVSSAYSTQKLCVLQNGQSYKKKTGLCS